MFDLPYLVRLWRRRRRAAVALCTALIFASVAGTAASHQHHGYLERQACAACVMLAGLADAPPAPSLALVLLPQLPYRLETAACYACLYAAPPLLPPSCGPPPLA
ncbi:MAG TPA: hypothetical protein VFG03_09425 [Telluria sp.]|nr:hypothetical protein [Telluria sp.]